MDPLSIVFLIVLIIGGFCMFVGFLMGVWYFNCEYIFPIIRRGKTVEISLEAIFGKIAEETVRGTLSLNEKLKPLASFWLIGISLAVIFIGIGIVYGSNLLGSSTDSATARYCTAPLPEKLPGAEQAKPTTSAHLKLNDETTRTKPTTNSQAKPDSEPSTRIEQTPN